MVTHHELGEISHNREEESDERRAVETPLYLAETMRALMEELQSCKAEKERLIKEKEKQIEINTVLLQILSDIQRQLKHRPIVVHVNIHHTKKARHGSKRHSMEESYGEETNNSKGSSSRKTSSHS
jgi:hypothetical protein